MMGKIIRSIIVYFILQKIKVFNKDLLRKMSELFDHTPIEQILFSARKGDEIVTLQKDKCFQPKAKKNSKKSNGKLPPKSELSIQGGSEEDAKNFVKWANIAINIAKSGIIPSIYSGCITHHDDGTTKVNIGAFIFHYRMQDVNDPYKSLYRTEKQIDLYHEACTNPNAIWSCDSPIETLRKSGIQLEPRKNTHGPYEGKWQLFAYV